MLEFVAIKCGCCPHIRRGTIISYLDHHFPEIKSENLAHERRFFKLEGIEKFNIDGEIIRPCCPKGEPIPFEALHKVLGSRVGVRSCELYY